MKLNREYLHLDEVREISGISDFDLIDYFRRGKLNLYAWCSETHLIAEAALTNSNKQCTIGKFSYSGVVLIPKQKLESLIDGTKKVFVDKFLIQELDQIKNWTSDAPSKISYPNKSFETHIKMDSPPTFKFYAFINAEDSISKHANLLKVMRSLDQIGQKHQDEYIPSQHLKKMQNTFNENVSYTQKMFMLSDLRFSKSELFKAANIPITTIDSSPESKPSMKAPSPLDEIILKILKAQPSLKSDQIWNVLKRESKLEIFDREYDEYGIIEEIGFSNINWRNQAEEPKSISRNSFKNKISKLKKYEKIN